MKLYGEVKDRTHYIHHKDGDNSNCDINNLEWKKRGPNIKTRPAFPVIVTDTRTGCEVAYPTITLAAKGTGFSTTNLQKLIKGEYISKKKWYIKVRKGAL
jgi:hypothetical protein